MKLVNLLKDQNYQASRPVEHAIVHSVTTDSRRVSPGDLFITLKALDKSDVTPHIREAINKGALYILKDKDTALGDINLNDHPDLIIIDVENSRLARTRIAANMYPRSPYKIAAVTGTNGKTSVVNFLRQIWELCHIPAASIGTIGVQSLVPNLNLPMTSLTSPEPFALHQSLQILAEHDVHHLAIEASSHGLDQNRLDCLDLSAAAFTNLSHEHLDYHGTINHYFAAKMRLFAELLPEGATAVLNADDFHYKTLLEACHKRGHQLISFGRQAHDIELIDATMTPQGQILQLKIFGKRYDINAPLIGLVQGYNIMTAIGLALGCGLDIENIIQAIPKLKSVPGRFERVGQHPSGGMVYVDYSHKPLALETVLTSLRPHFKGLLTAVFGCGGNRDAQKRPMMGLIAAQHADIVIITDDNPRHEDPAVIRQQICQGCPAALEVADRQQAIFEAIRRLEVNDACVIAGKGHEQNQIIGDRVIPFDDREVAREILRKLGGSIFD